MKKILFLTLVCFLIAVGNAQATDTPTVSNVYQTAIVGCGVGGIKTLNSLANAGQTNIICLEADPNRYGGRIDTFFVPGNPKAYERGASFFHDSNYNPTIAVATQQCGMTFQAMDFNSNSAWKDGRFLNVNQRTKIYMDYLNAWEGVDAYRQFGRSIADAIRLAGYDFDNRGVETLMMTDEQVIGDNLEFSSSVGVNSPPGDLGSDYIITSPGGYKQFLDCLLDTPISVRNKLQLGSRVTKVDLTTPSGKVTITYIQGGVTKTLIANKVEIAVPMGVLKAGTIQFVPALPAAYQGAIDRALFGNVNKGFLFYSPTSAIAQKLTSLPVNIFYKIAVGDDPRYNDQLTYFYNNMFIQGQPVIQSYYSGNYSRMTETMTDAQVLALHTTALNFLVDSNNGGNNNNVNGQTPLPDPDIFIRTQWGKNPNIRGVYTDFGIYSTLADFTIFGTPIQNKLFFAGEYVLIEDPNAPGTVTGSIGTVYNAYLSAELASQKILGL